MRGAAHFFLLLAALLILAASVGAQTGPPPGAHEKRLHALAYHPFPDAGDPETGNRDPYGFPAVDGRDWMSATYGAYWFPTTRFDGVLEASYAVDGTISDMRQFYERYVELLDERALEDTPVGLRLDGQLDGSKGRVEVRLTPIVPVASRSLLARVVVFEDHIPFEGGNGVDVHRFTARAMLPPQPVDFSAGAPAAFNRSFDVAPDWNRDHLGVVVYVQNLDETAPNLDPLEVVQAATYRFDQEEPTLQRNKGVLLEMYTATWCPSCVYGDGAMDLLARENGHPTLQSAGANFAYFRPPSALAAALGVAAGLVVALLVTPRRNEND